MRAITIAWKDFRHTYRNIAGLAMMLVAPLLLATALGAAFGAGGNFSIPPIKTALVNEDKGSAGVDAGAGIVQTLTSPELSDLLAITPSQDAQSAREAVDTGDADVAVIIPAGLTAAVTSQQGGSAQVLVYKDPSLTIGPAIVSAIVQSVVQAIDGARAAAATAAQMAAALGTTDPAQLTDCGDQGGPGLQRRRARVSRPYPWKIEGRSSPAARDARSPTWPARCCWA